MPYVFYDKPCVFFGTPKRLPEVGDFLPEEVKLQPGMRYVFSGCLSVFTGKLQILQKIRANSPVSRLAKTQKISLLCRVDFQWFGKAKNTRHLF